MVNHQYWRRSETVTARPIESVVLPAAIKDKIVSDLDDFVDSGTRSWYTVHGIPYKRSYLLYGSPGAGKTSLIQALAGRYRRNVCYLSPSHPEMTDDALKAAVQRVPERSILVLEDVDSLFGSNGRVKKESDKSALTFSGVLNALDGVGGSSGQIFMLTTNCRDSLDPALIRNGRVDCHVPFSDATAEQMTDLFAQFYPDADVSLAERFSSSLTKLLEAQTPAQTVSMAALQHYFIMMRRASAEEAAKGVKKVLEEAEAHGALKSGDASTDEKKGDGDPATTDGTKKAEQAGNGVAQEANGKTQGSGTGKCGSTSKEVHVHVHMHGEA